ncbi:hypothetical protein H4R21_006815, partial [Coemansia helicoidea]
FFIGSGMFAPMFFIPIWYTIVKNASAISGGLHLLPYFLGLSLVSIASGFIVTKTGRYRLLVSLGTAVFIVGLGLLTLFDGSTNSGKQIGFLLIAGVGVGFNIQILLIVVQTAAPVEDMAAATTLFLFSRTLGSSIGIAIMQSVLQNAIIPKLGLLAAQHPEYADVFMVSLNDQSAIYKGGLPIDVQAQLVSYYVGALQKVFIANVAIAAVSLPFTFFLKHVPLRANMKPTVGE